MDKFVDKALNKIGDRVKKEVKERIGHLGDGSHNVFHSSSSGEPVPLQANAKAHMPYPGQQPPGPGNRDCLKVKNVTYHDKMQFHLPNGQRHDVLRDLGFSGVLDGRVVWTFGDTLMGNEEKHHICAVDSTGITTDMARPLNVMDSAMKGSNVANFINCNEHEQANGGLSCWSFGGSNVLEVAPNLGLCYYLKIHRPGGNVTVHGAGVCEVRMQGNVPVATRCGDKLWTEREPAWGDVGVMLDPRDNHVYVFGHGFPNNKELSHRVYLARVPRDQYHNIAAYEYWLNNRREWTKQRLTMTGHYGSLAIEAGFSVFPWMAYNQSAPFWSNHFNCWMVLHGTSWGYSDVICKTADRLEGPWRDHGIVAKTEPQHGEKDGLRYCHNGHPQFDHSGRTVLVTWTKCNVIWGATIEWE